MDDQLRHEVRGDRGGFQYELYMPGKKLPFEKRGGFKTHQQASSAAMQDIRNRMDTQIAESKNKRS